MQYVPHQQYCINCSIHLNALIVRHSMPAWQWHFTPSFGLVAQTNAYSFHLLSLFGTLYPPLYIPLPAFIPSSVQ